MSVQLCRPVAQAAAADDGVEVCIVPGDGTVKLRITPTGSPLPSPRPPRQDASDGNGAASPEATASPLSGSAHSFEHLSQVCYKSYVTYLLSTSGQQEHTFGSYLTSA